MNPEALAILVSNVLLNSKVISVKSYTMNRSRPPFVTSGEIAEAYDGEDVTVQAEILYQTRQRMSLELTFFMTRELLVQLGESPEVAKENIFIDELKKL